MKKLTLSAMVTVIVGLSSASAFANTNNHHLNNMHSLSKRPFQKLPNAHIYHANDKWTGAAMNGAAPKSANNVNNHHLKFHFLGKRPYMD